MSDKYSLIYSPDAIDDLRDIFSYISVDLVEPQTARMYVKRIRDKIQRLDQFPLCNPLVESEPWHSLQMRKLIVDHFIIFYLVDIENKTVSVVRIIYGGRDIDAVLSK